MLVDILVFLVALLLFLYYRGTRNWNKFKLRGIPEAKPTWPFGSAQNWKLLFSKTGVSEQYRVFFGTELEKEKMFGIYGHPDKDAALIINDVDLAKRMLVKDFDHFVDRTDFGIKLDKTNEVDMIFGHSFMMQKGDEWKKNRNLMTPVFTTGKLKLMYNILEKCGTNLGEFIEDSSTRDLEMDAKDVFSKFALDGIASSGFGIDSNSFKEPNNTFRAQVLELMRAPGSESGSNYEITKLVLKGIWPWIQYIVSVPNIPSKAAIFLKNILLKTIKHRETSHARRNDIIDFILDQLKSKKEEDTENQFEDEFEKDASLDMSTLGDTNESFDKEQTLVSNGFLLFLAALDTTSSTLTFVVHYLMKHPEIQERARDEIMEVIGTSKKVTFDHIQSLKYLDNVIFETLRNVHPFANILERECTKDYKIPGTEHVVKKGEVVNFSFLLERMKKDNESFYNSNEFDPDNFDASNNPDQFSFLGFGQGPRNCIGKRYAMISIKIALISILRKFRVVKTKNTKEDLELFKFTAGAEVLFKAISIEEMEE